MPARPPEKANKIMPEGSIRTAPAPAAASTAGPPSRRRRWLRPALMLGGVLVVVVGAGAFWLHGGRYAGTDDAYVQADKLLLATDVASIVQRIAVREGDTVKPGQILVVLDPAPFRHALDQMQAQLQQTALSL